MRIFRVQAFNGNGPYMGSNISDVAGIGCLISEHPNPYGDAGLCEAWENMHSYEQDEFYFGFKDLNQLSNWFMYPDLNMEAAELGWIVEYEVNEEDYVIGQFQAIFKRQNATSVKYLHLGTLEELSTEYVTEKLSY